MHKLLERQIKTTLGGIDPTNLTSGWQRFFDALNSTYQHVDEDRTLLTRSLELSSREHLELNRRLKEEAAEVNLRLAEMQKQNAAQQQTIDELTRELATLKK